MLPTFMSWISSTIGVVCLAFTEFQFTEVFFFRPLIIVMMVTYYMGCYTLPALLTYIDIDVCHLGEVGEEDNNAIPLPEMPSEHMSTSKISVGEGILEETYPPDEPKKTVVVK